MRIFTKKIKIHVWNQNHSLTSCFFLVKMAITARHGYVTAVITAVLKARFPTLAKLHRDKQKKDCEQVQAQKLHEHTVGDEIENLISMVRVQIGKTKRYLNDECEKLQKIWWK